MVVDDCGEVREDEAADGRQVRKSVFNQASDAETPTGIVKLACIVAVFEHILPTDHDPKVRVEQLCVQE